MIPFTPQVAFTREAPCPIEELVEEVDEDEDSDSDEEEVTDVTVGGTLKFACSCCWSVDDEIRADGATDDSDSDDDEADDEVDDVDEEDEVRKSKHWLMQVAKWF